jgi:hypothetical protein
MLSRVGVPPPVDLPIDVEEVSLNEKLVTRNISKHAFGHVTLRNGMVDVNLHRAVLKFQMFIDGFELEEF